MLDKTMMTALVERCSGVGAALVSDEIYHGIEYERPAVTALSVTNDVHVINSFSKYYSMTGWRIGWMVVPDAHVRTVERLAQDGFKLARRTVAKYREAAGIPTSAQRRRAAKLRNL